MKAQTRRRGDRRSPRPGKRDGPGAGPPWLQGRHRLSTGSNLGAKNVAELESLNVEAMIRKSDVTAVAERPETLLKRCSTVSAALMFSSNNAGAFIAKSFEQTSVEEWREMIDSNLHSGAFMAARRLCPIMKKTAIRPDRQHRTGQRRSVCMPIKRLFLMPSPRRVF